MYCLGQRATKPRSALCSSCGSEVLGANHQQQTRQCKCCCNCRLQQTHTKLNTYRCCSFYAASLLLQPAVCAEPKHHANLITALLSAVLAAYVIGRSDFVINPGSQLTSEAEKEAFDKASRCLFGGMLPPWQQ